MTSYNPTGNPHSNIHQNTSEVFSFGFSDDDDDDDDANNKNNNDDNNANTTILTAPVAPPTDQSTRDLCNKRKAAGDSGENDEDGHENGHNGHNGQNVEKKNKRPAPAFPSFSQLQHHRNARLTGLYGALWNFTRRPYTYAVVREDVSNLTGKQASVGDIVQIDWLSSSHFELVVYPLYQARYLPEGRVEQIKAIVGSNGETSTRSNCSPQDESAELFRALNEAKLRNNKKISGVFNNDANNIGNKDEFSIDLIESKIHSKATQLILIPPSPLNLDIFTSYNTRCKEMTEVDAQMGENGEEMAKRWQKVSEKCQNPSLLFHEPGYDIPINIKTIEYTPQRPVGIEYDLIALGLEDVKNVVEFTTTSTLVTCFHHPSSLSPPTTQVNCPPRFAPSSPSNQQYTYGDYDVIIEYDLRPMIVNPFTINISSLTFISTIDDIANHTQLSQLSQPSLVNPSQHKNNTTQLITHQPRNTNYVFELFPFLSHMQYPFTHPPPQPSSQSSPQSYQSPSPHPIYPSHYSSSPLVVDSTLESWSWPVSSTFFQKEIFGKKCFVVHTGGKRLSTIRSDLYNFNIKSLIETSPSTIIWMKTQPNKHPNEIVGEEKGEKTMHYIATSPEVAFSSYLAGHTIYFNPLEPIQAKYVKSLATQLGHGYGYTPNSTNFEKDGGMTHLDESGSFGGDMEIFAVNTSHITDWHFDSQDNISIQLVGLKQWFVCPGLDQPVTNFHPKSINKQSVCADRYMHQLSSLNCSGGSAPMGVGLESEGANTSQEVRAVNHPNFDNHPNTETFLVRPGTIFYHPAGTYHKVVALNGDGSLSLNISLDCLRYSDVLLSALSQMIMTHPLLRQRINTCRDDVEEVIRNAIGNVIPQMLKGIVENNNNNNGEGGKQTMIDTPICLNTDDNSTQMTSSTSKSIKLVKKPTGLFIPAIFTNNQIHDYPITTITSLPSHPLYHAISSLLYKDHGCVNLSQYLGLNAEMVDFVFSFYTGTNDTNNINNATNNTTNTITTTHNDLNDGDYYLEQLTKMNQYVGKYYPEVIGVIEEFCKENRHDNQNRKNNHHDIENNKNNSHNPQNGQINDQKKTLSLNSFDNKLAQLLLFKTNRLVAVIGNEPQYMINVGSKPSQPITSKLTIHNLSNPNQPTIPTLIQYPSNQSSINFVDCGGQEGQTWPHITQDDITLIKSSKSFLSLLNTVSSLPTLHQTINGGDINDINNTNNTNTINNVNDINNINNPTHAPKPLLDTSTLAALFGGKRFNATQHLYSICTGFSTHSTTSNLTPSAINTKVGPQYSIGIVIDAARLAFQTVAGGRENAGKLGTSFSSSSSSSAAQRKTAQFVSLPEKRNHTFLNIVLFVLWALQHGVDFTFESLVCCCEQVAVMGSYGDDVMLTPLVRVVIRTIAINLVALYTHCGVFIPK